MINARAVARDLAVTLHHLPSPFLPQLNKVQYDSKQSILNLLRSNFAFSDLFFLQQCSFFVFGLLGEQLVNTSSSPATHQIVQNVLGVGNVL